MVWAAFMHIQFFVGVDDWTQQNSMVITLLAAIAFAWWRLDRYKKSGDLYIQRFEVQIESEEIARQLERVAAPSRAEADRKANAERIAKQRADVQSSLDYEREQLEQAREFLRQKNSR